MMTGAEIRSKFLEFFQSKEHTIVPSAPIVVKNDPTLMFTNAGMNQFKDYFLGNKKPTYARVADTQKCLRVSGKHNDLEEVGVDTYHHTMFEMLGNWSFGNPNKPEAGYFKKEAIAWSWELLTGVYKLDKNRLYVTIFEGDEKEGLPKDEEAYIEWKKWVAEDRILLGNKKDNFWEMGDTGPCGPCTEIHFDSRPEANNDGHKLVNNDETGMLMEVWNNVFIQFNRKKDGSLEPLPAKHVDTGMGLERLVRVIQGKNSNYDTDIFKPLIDALIVISKRDYLTNPRSIDENNANIAIRVIVDHIRAVSFCIADGQLPSNTGAGYVVRRILRRAVRYGFSYLNLKEPFLYKLTSVLANEFESIFPELNNQIKFVKDVIREEEVSFFRTLSSGITRFKNYAREAKSLYSGGYVADLKDNDEVKQKYIDTQIEFFQERKNKIVAGKFTFELFDTYGFPLDLTILLSKEVGWNVDVKGFEAEMQLQKERSRAASTIDAQDWVVIKEGNNQFVGYDALEVKSSLLKYRKIKTKGKEAYQLVLEKTPFYAESGGQVGDTGELSFGNEIIEITDTKKDNDLVIHFSEKLPENVSADVIAKVNRDKRKNITLHHSATHLLHAALRKVLGTHVAQKGSLVNEEHLRFDFSHFTKVTGQELVEIENLVNDKIRENIPVVIKEMPKDEAMRMGAMALFGEKYGDTVRVVIIDPAYSVELCGGTHVGATGEIGLFKLITETAVAAGVRRVEAVCGKEAEKYIQKHLSLLQSLKEMLKNPKDIQKAVENLQTDNITLKKHVDALEARQLVGIRNELLQKDEIINGVNFVGDIIEVGSPESLKKLCYDLQHHLRDHLAVICTNSNGKPFVAVSVSETVVKAKGLDANKIIKEHVAPVIKGGGGGQKTLATAGGQEAGNLQLVIDKVRALL